VAQHDPGGVGDRCGGLVDGGRGQPAAHAGEHVGVVGEDDLLLGAEVPEERRPADAGALGDGVHGRRLVAVALEQVERGPAEARCGIGHGLGFPSVPSSGSMASSTAPEGEPCNEWESSASD
jgi:hypothetical protein